MLTDEPVPRLDPEVWSEVWPSALSVKTAPAPSARPERSFLSVLQARRSTIGGPIGFQQIADLLWYATAPSPMGMGRAGIAVEHRPYPSAGGLHAIRLVMIDHATRDVALYEPAEHRFHLVDAPGLAEANDAAVAAMVGRPGGCTLRFLADIGKAQAAYRAPESLLLRDAGCLIATLCLCAEWLDLSAIPLGFLGVDLPIMLGFPLDDFAGIGGILVSTR